VRVDFWLGGRGLESESFDHALSMIELAACAVYLYIGNRLRGERLDSRASGGAAGDGRGWYRFGLPICNYADHLVQYTT
jgi:hypothetical protein